MAAAEALPERVVCSPLQKELLCCLLSTNRCPQGTEAGDRSGQPRSACRLRLPAAAQMSFQDLGVNYVDQLNHEKLTRYFVKRLTRLGHRVTIEPCQASA